MSKLIKVKRGPKEGIPSNIVEGEPVWAVDSEELYIGSGSGEVTPACKCYSNQRIAGLELSQGAWREWNHIFIISLQVPFGYYVTPTLLYGRVIGMDSGLTFGTTDTLSIDYIGTGNCSPIIVIKDSSSPSSEWVKLYYKIKLEYNKTP